jgi:hypothetical protein
MLAAAGGEQLLREAKSVIKQQTTLSHPTDTISVTGSSPACNKNSTAQSLTLPQSICFLQPVASLARS